MSDHGGDPTCADATQEIRNVTVIPHRGFSCHIKVYADIGLIRLNEPAKLDQNNINTICLPFPFVDVPHWLQVIGWGSTVGLNFYNNFKIQRKVFIFRRVKRLQAFY